MNKNLELTDIEQNVLEHAVNFYWNNAHNNLQRNDLGDIEKVCYSVEKENCKNILIKLEKL